MSGELHKRAQAQPQPQDSQFSSRQGQETQARQQPRGSGARPPGLLTRIVQGVFSLVSVAEFEILFVAFFVIVYLWIKDFLSHPDYNRILVDNPWPFPVQPAAGRRQE